MAESGSLSGPDGAFRAAYGAGDGWQDSLQACLDALATPPEGANLGLVYTTDVLADHLSDIVARLRAATGIQDWLGTVGTGVSACGLELHDRPAVVLLAGAVPAEAFRVIEPVSEGLGAFETRHGRWIAERTPYFGIVHGDPRTAGLPDLVAGLSALSSSFLVGGLSASRGEMWQVAGEVSQGGLSGALFSPDIKVVTGLSQGCTPIGPRRLVTEAESNVVKTIDERPAVEVFIEDIGELLARDLRRIGGYVYVAFPIAESDTGDYLVRNLTGIDTDKGWLGVGHSVVAGDRIQFCRRDHDAAVKDLKRMLADVKRRSDSAPRAGLYYACVARGPNLFGSESEELRLIRDELGEFPLVGFFANGEISHDRLYGYTGVLALIL
jgi:small ligand-binding sensory domain FIST